MAATTKMTLHEKITRKEFDQVLGQYPALIESISQSRPAKNGQKTLQELDQYRYVDAPEIFGGDEPKREMNLDDVKSLVEWKLRHGKFRPTLMTLVSSNPPPFTSQTIQSALQSYRSTTATTANNNNITTALQTLTKLKGIGPATASLLLTIHDPQRVIFFSDEAFYWLCCQGKKSPIKYTPKEYQALREEADGLAQRLGVSATDIEKVAYVLMKQPGLPSNGDDETLVSKGSKKPAITKVAKRKAVSVKEEIEPKATKQKAADKKEEKKADEKESEKEGDNDPPVRRSKRLRK
ncbi:hypothetical protein PT974_06186 [Cladobotryum mycophilum]|uniref:Uncharacterized protein n=1 Tax=Cladobotryum mycophilum TaxID=491253 RepID=A0ABR0SKV0_9HYPO